MTTKIIDNIFYSERLVRFSYCDPAGIVFFPQYFIMFNGLVEDWFNQGLGLDYANYITEHRLGFPVVSLNCDFVAPSRIGERITLGLRLEHMGKSSLKLSVTCSYKGEERVRANLVLVAMDLDKAKAIPVPEELRLLMAGFQAGKLDINQFDE
ncbi:MAG TPA: acyl-CoA thioesterase [Oxalobacteraceae bacterium]|jgi:4-hydroxybenzoyl-CoA thioesterase|nr:acyl-CoA thioesterase [Oxalobacteraceae bacterium]HCN89969.1 acyl-CoA thioesterase [Oxalobacteraceae bacterium]